MDAKVSGDFWSDPAIEKLTMEQKLAALWSLTSSRTNLAGYVEVSKMRFEFETGCPYDALLSLPDAHAKGFKKCGDGIWARRFIAHQIGSGPSLVRNKMATPLIRELRGWHGHPFVEHVLLEYPELVTLYSEAEETPQLPLSNAHGMGQRREEQSSTEKNSSKTPSKPQDLVGSPALSRARKIFRMRDSTPLDSSQIAAWKKNRGVLEAAEEEHWLALEWYYSRPAEENLPLRQDLATLINHFNGEVIRARAYCAKVGKKFGEKKVGAWESECPDWKNLLLEANPELSLPELWDELLPDAKKWAWELHREKNKGGES